MKGKVISIGIVLFILSFIAISGCNDPGEMQKINPNYNIVYSNTPIVEKIDNSAEVYGSIENKGNVDYKDVKFNVMGLDKAGNVIDNKTIPIDIFKPGERFEYNVAFEDARIISAKIEIISATNV